LHTIAINKILDENTTNDEDSDDEEYTLLNQMLSKNATRQNLRALQNIVGSREM